MDPADRKKVVEAVRAQISELCERMPALEEGAKPVPPDGAVGRLSRMDAIGQRGVHQAALREAKERLARLEERLRRSDEPDFDLCAACRKPIAPARLIFLPDSDRCVNCS